MDLMIELTRLNGQTFAINADLIERIDITPDTVITPTVVAIDAPMSLSTDWASALLECSNRR
jgi:hypothetical protein